MKESKYTLQSVDNALSVLELLLQHNGLGITEISRKLELGKATCFRLVSTLENRGFLDKDDNAKYRLGKKFIYYGTFVKDSIDYVAEVNPFLEELNEEFNETVHMAIKDGNEIIFVDKVSGDRTIQMTSRVGARLPIYCTGTGKVLLAFSSPEVIEDYTNAVFPATQITKHTITDLDAFLEVLNQIRINGYGFDLEESEVGLVCYAAPVYDFTNKVTAAISISGPSMRMRQKKDALIKAVTKTAKRASAVLGAKV